MYYILDENDKPESVTEPEWREWYFKQQRDDKGRIVIDKTPITVRGKIRTFVITWFEYNLNVFKFHDDIPLCFWTGEEGSEKYATGVATRKEAVRNHKRQVERIYTIYKSKYPDRRKQLFKRILHNAFHKS